MGLLFFPMSFGKHPSVEDTRNEGLLAIHSVEDDMARALHPAQAGTHVVARPTQIWIVCEHPATSLQVREVAGGLLHAPGPEAVRPNIRQVL